MHGQPHIRFTNNKQTNNVMNTAPVDRVKATIQVITGRNGETLAEEER